MRATSYLRRLCCQWLALEKVIGDGARRSENCAKLHSSFTNGKKTEQYIPKWVTPITEVFQTYCFAAESALITISEFITSKARLNELLLWTTKSKFIHQQRFSFVPLFYVYISDLETLQKRVNSNWWNCPRHLLMLWALKQKRNSSFSAMYFPNNGIKW